METLSYTDARNRLRELMEQVVENHEAVRISRRGGQAVVLLSESDYEGLREILYLLSNPVNAERLLAARPWRSNLLGGSAGES